MDLAIANADSVTHAPELELFTGTQTVGPNFQFTTDLLANGDFEIEPFTTVGVATAWQVTGNVSEFDYGTTLGHNAAFSVGADSQGDTLSQVFYTVANGVYEIDFDSGIYGQHSSDPLQLNVQVFGTDSEGVQNADLVLFQNVTPPEAGTFDGSAVQFQHYHFTFVADSSYSRVQFTDIGLGNGGADTLLDRVVIVPSLTTSINVITPPSDGSGASVQISGLFLPSDKVRVLQSFDLVTFGTPTDAPTDANGAYSVNLGTPAGHTAVFFKVVYP
jgi:hypothetical protein